MEICVFVYNVLAKPYVVEEKLIKSKSYESMMKLLTYIA